MRKVIISIIKDIHNYTHTISTHAKSSGTYVQLLNSLLVKMNNYLQISYTLCSNCLNMISYSQPCTAVSRHFVKLDALVIGVKALVFWQEGDSPISVA